MFADAPVQQHNWFRLCLLGFLFGFSLIFMNVLNSALTSSMTIRSDEDFINTYTDVLGFPRVRIYSEYGSHFTRVFKVIDSGALQFRCNWKFDSPRLSSSAVPLSNEGVDYGWMGCTEIFTTVVIFPTQNTADKPLEKLNSRLIQVRGILQPGSAAMAMISEVESKTRVIVCPLVVCWSIIIQKEQSSGRCPHVMLSSISTDLLTGSVLVSRSLSKAIRELIVRAWVQTKLSQQTSLNQFHSLTHQYLN